MCYELLGTSGEGELLVGLEEEVEVIIVVAVGLEVVVGFISIGVVVGGRVAAAGLLLVGVVGGLLLLLLVVVVVGGGGCSFFDEGVDIFRFSKI